jgi:hypothetical protein
LAKPKTRNATRKVGQIKDLIVWTYYGGTTRGFFKNIKMKESTR